MPANGAPGRRPVGENGAMGVPVAGGGDGGGERRLLIRLSARAGHVTVTAEPRDDVVVGPGGRAEEVGDGSIEVRAQRPRDSIDVSCPLDTDVIIGTASGRVELRGRFGVVGVTSQSGSIAVGSAAEADVRSVSGAVHVDRCVGRCRVSTTSGRIRVGASGDTVVAATSGSVHLDDVTGAVRVRSVSATVSIAGEAAGPIEVSTVSGSIDIRLPSDARPRVLVKGRPKVISDFEAGDDVAISVASVSGTIRLLPA